MRTYSVLTWNINGIRSAKNLKNTLDSLDADIICLQETKITRDMLSAPTAIVPGYSAYFDFSQRRSGYSGVATYCRDGATPAAAEAGLAGSRAAAAAVGCYGEIAAELDWPQRAELDAEGRCMVTLHRLNCQCPGHQPEGCRLAVVNVYCPRVDPERPERLLYKLQFYRALRLRARALQAAGYHVLVVGDLNCSHRTIDTCDPGQPQDFHSSPSRQFLDSWLVPPAASPRESSPTLEDDTRLVDTFRHLHPDTAEAYTCWNTQKSARECNYGTRIDYVLCDRRLTAQLQRCDVMADVQGSDHCPVRAEWRGDLVAAPVAPPACTRWYPEFAGKQVTLRELCARLPSKPPHPEGRTPAQIQAGNGAGKRTGLAGKRAVEVEGRNAKTKRSRGGQATLLSFFKASAVQQKRSGSSDPAEGEPATALRNIVNECAVASTEDARVQENGVAAADATSDGPECPEPADRLSVSASVSSASDGPDRPEPAERLSVIPSASSAADSRSSQGTDDSGYGRSSSQEDLASSSGDHEGGASAPAAAASFWRQTLAGRRAPSCRGHRQPCVLRVVKKAGPNIGRSFWCCPRGVGRPGDPQARCDHFEWVRR